MAQSQEVIAQALALINSETAGLMNTDVNELIGLNEKFQNGVKSAGAKCRKKTTAWGKAVRTRITELKQAKKLFAEYRKLTIAESKKDKANPDQPTV